jgi:hypothetical protein
MTRRQHVSHKHDYLKELPEGTIKIDYWNGQKVYGIYYNDGHLPNTQQSLMMEERGRFKILKRQITSFYQPYVFVNKYDGKRVSVCFTILEAVAKEIMEKEPMKTVKELNAIAEAERQELTQELKQRIGERSGESSSEKD